MNINSITQHKLDFDINKYKFKEQIENLFRVSDLSTIHNTWKSDYELLNDHTKDQATVYHRRFYDKAKEETNFYDIYKLFIEQEIRPLFNESIIYQTIPTFRTHLPNNLGVAEFHRDRDYSHSPNEINVFLPMTEAKNTNTIWSESEEGKEDFSPMRANYGDYYIWIGANLLHGNKTNTSNKTRISIDFRFMPESKYKNTNQISITNKTKMTIGEYFTLLK